MRCASTSDLSRTVRYSPIASSENGDEPQLFTLAPRLQLLHYPVQGVITDEYVCWAIGAEDEQFRRLAPRCHVDHPIQRRDITPV